MSVEIETAGDAWADNEYMMGINNQEETEIDIEDMIAQVAEAMAGGKQFDGCEETSAGRFVGTDINRKPFGVMRVAAANAQSRCASGDARQQARRMVEYMMRIRADLLFVTETNMHDKRTKKTVEAVEGAHKDLGYGAKCTVANQHGSGVMIGIQGNPGR
jgi:hypothetical protein